MTAANRALRAAMKPVKKPKGRSKFGAVPTMRGERRFDSAKEARRFDELVLRVRIGEIEWLECQPRYDLTVNGVLVCEIVPDFRYRVKATGEIVIEDVKGGSATQTPEWRIKRKLFEALNPSLKITVV